MGNRVLDSTVVYISKSSKVFVFLGFEHVWGKILNSTLFAVADQNTAQLFNFELATIYAQVISSIVLPNQAKSFSHNIVHLDSRLASRLRPRRRLE